MKWKENLGIIVLFIVFWQGINWVLNSLGLEDLTGGTLTFLISLIFVSLIVIILIQIQQNKEIRKIEKKIGIEEEKGVLEKIIKQMKGKKGMVIDPRILFWILIIIFGYLFLKSIGILN